MAVSQTGKQLPVHKPFIVYIQLLACAHGCTRLAVAQCCQPDHCCSVCCMHNVDSLITVAKAVAQCCQPDHGCRVCCQADRMHTAAIDKIGIFAESAGSFLPDMSLDSRIYLHMHGVWQPGVNSSAPHEDLRPDQTSTEL